MDGERFDRLTRALSDGMSRRRAVRAFAGSLVAVAVAAAKPGAAGADDCKRADKPCKKHSQCCSGLCVPETGLCGCTAPADCDDRNGCTVDLCGPVSHQCFHLEFGSSCVQCRSSAHCPGRGACCGGRCCAPGATCSTNSLGLPVCCPTCENGQSCCDVISFDPTGASGGYEIDPGICVGGDACPSFCCPGGQGGCGVAEDGSIFVVCSSPVGTVS